MEKQMELKQWFEQEIVPCVRADGGWLEIRKDEGETVVLTAKGECVRCASLDRCLKWAEQRARDELKRELRFTVVREPFLWRK